MPHQCTSCGHVFADGSKEMLSGCPDCGGNKFQFRPGTSVGGNTMDSNESGADGSRGADGAKRDDRSNGDPSDDAQPPERPGDDASAVARTVGRATTKVRDFVATDDPNPTAEPKSDAEWPDEWDGDDVDSGTSPDHPDDPLASGGNASNIEIEADDDIIDADARRQAREADGDEDGAQASARTDVVTPDEIDDGTDGSDESTDEDSGPTDETDAAIEDSGESAERVQANFDDFDSQISKNAADGTIVSEPTGEEADLAELREQLNDQFESIKVLEPGQYELNLMELYDRDEYIIALQENGRYVIQVPERWMGEDPDDR